MRDTSRHRTSKEEQIKKYFERSIPAMELLAEIAPKLIQAAYRLFPAARDRKSPARESPATG